MKCKPDKKRLNEIEDVYRSLGLQSEEVRRDLVALGTLPDEAGKERKTTFIEADTTSFSTEELTDARLESTFE